MKALKWAALVAVLVAAAGLGAAFAPVARGQARAVTAPRALDTLVARGSRIGVSIRDVEEADAKAGKLQSQAGVVIEDVTADSPAEKAGIKKGDIVVEYDGERVRSARQFTRLVQETPAGRKVSTSLVRDGQRVNVTIEPREGDGFGLLTDLDGVTAWRNLRKFRALPVPPTPPAAPAPPSAPFPPTPPMAKMFPDLESFVWQSGNSLGVVVSDLSSQLAEYFGAKDGVLVTSVYDQSAAAKAGVKAGDVITAFNDSSVGSPSELRQRVQRMREGDEFSITVVRDKKSLTLKGKFETSRNRRIIRSIV
jgi:S1-C subfamily serine protease